MKNDPKYWLPSVNGNLYEKLSVNLYENYSLKIYETVLLNMYYGKGDVGKYPTK